MSEPAPPAFRVRALHYLVLRHLASLSRTRDVDAALHREIAESLTADTTPEGFDLAWEARGEALTLVLEEGEFALYSHGDGGEREAPASWWTSLNERRGQDLAREALGLEAEAPQAERHLRLRVVLGSVTALILPVAVAFAGGVNGIALGALLFAWQVVDAVPRVGPLLASLPLATMAYASAAHAAALGGALYALFQLVDPDPRLRLARVLLLGTVVAFGAWLAPTWAPPPVELPVLAAIALATPIAFLARWTFGRHERALPVALPFVALGLGWDGRAHEALAVLAVSLASTLGWTLRAHWTRLRRARALSLLAALLPFAPFVVPSTPATAAPADPIEGRWLVTTSNSSGESAVPGLEVKRDSKGALAAAIWATAAIRDGVAYAGTEGGVLNLKTSIEREGEGRQRRLVPSASAASPGPRGAKPCRSASRMPSRSR